jgi:large repetitive protein
MRRPLAMMICLTTAMSVTVPAVQVLSSTAAHAVEAGSVGAKAASSWQSNATVWHMAYGTGRVYMVGDFTSLRPSGDAKGTGEVPSNYFAALTASTGALDTGFNHTHSFTGQTAGTLPLTDGAVATSPSGSVVYVGGTFTHVDGASRVHIAAFNATTGALLPWNPNVSGKVSAIATEGDNVYVGGTFGTVGGVARTNLADISATTAKALPWAADNTPQPSTDGSVHTVAVSADGNYVVAGGYFDEADGMLSNGSTFYNKAVIIGGAGHANAGQLEPMSANKLVVPPGTGAHPVNGCSSAVKDAVISDDIAYIADEGTGGGCFDGTWAVNLSNGTLKWVNRCLGATQTIAVVGNYLYKGSHAHNCTSRNTNGDPDNFPDVAPNQSRHLLSQSINNGFLGPWYPFSNAGPNLGPRAMATDGSQLYVGGDFTQMNGAGQQGIARFTPATDYATPRPLAPTASSTVPTVVTISALAPVDRDDPDLTIQLFRDGGALPIASRSVHSLFWKQPTVTFTDAGLTRGSTHTYTVRAVEGSGAASSKSPASTQVTVN